MLVCKLKNVPWELGFEVKHSKFLSVEVSGYV